MPAVPHPADPHRSRRLLSIRECAQELSVSTRTVRRLLGTGDLVFVRLGRSVRISTVSVDRLIAKGGTS